MGEAEESEILSTDSNRHYEKSLVSGETVCYTLRGLSDDEVPQWASFCASVFSYKPNPPASSYFSRHYFNDPTHEARLVRVALGGDQGIKASCRGFLRCISLGGGKHIKVGGIGEVCTASDHRRRGLSAELLKDALAVMPDASASFLHAAPTFFPVYEKMGYNSVRSPWSEVTIDMDILRGEKNQSNLSAKIRLAKFPEDTPKLQSIHQTYSEERFVGCVVRSEDYWNSYISKELHGSLWVIENEDEPDISGWLCVRSRGERIQLRDFGSKTVSSVATVFRKMLCRALDSEASVTGQRMVRLHLPTPILEDIQSEKSGSQWVSSSISDDDDGWMYKPLVDAEIHSSIPHLAKSHSHIIWPSDSF